MSERGGSSVERLTTPAALEALRGEWADLVEACGVDPLCNGPDWVLAHRRTFAADTEVLCWVVRDASGRALALLPFKREHERGRLALRRAQFLADGSFDSDYQDVPCAPGREREVASTLVDLLADEPGLDAVLLQMVRRDSPFLAALSAELGSRHLPTRATRERGAVAELPETYDAYVAGLRSRVRSKVRQAERRAQDSQLAWFEPGDDLSAWLDELYDLHGRRWRASGRAGSFADGRRRAFYDAFLPDEAAAGRLVLARLRRDGRAIALQLGVRRGATYYQIQEGYEPELESERPGTQLRAVMVRTLIERGVRRYDFMEGFTRHKQEWGAVEVPCTTLSFALPRLRSRFVFAAKNLVDGYRASWS